MTPEQLQADPDFQKLSPEAQQIVLAKVAGNSSGEGRIKPTFWGALGQSAKERLGEVGQLPKDLVGFGGDVANVAGSVVPGWMGPFAAGTGSIVQDLTHGTAPDLSKAERAAVLNAGFGVLGKVLSPLSKVRIAGTGRAADAERVAEAVRGTDTALQPGKTAAELMKTMRGAEGQEAMGAAKDAADSAIAAKLPLTPKPIDTGTRAYLDAQVAGNAPVQAATPPLTREAYQAMVDRLKALGRQGFGLRGEARNSPAATAAREEYGQLLAELKAKAQQQGGAGLLEEIEKARRDFSAGTELRRLFRPNTGEGPDRVFRPGGFSLQDLQERVGKRLAEIGGRVGDEGADFIRQIYRGGLPGEGTDRPLTIGMSKFKGFALPTGLELMAGPMDSRMIQALLRLGGSGGATLLDALRKKP